MYRQVSKLSIADELSPMLQTCSPVVKYNYNSNGNLSSFTSSKVRAATCQVSWNRRFTDIDISHSTRGQFWESEVGKKSDFTTFRLAIVTTK